MSRKLVLAMTLTIVLVGVGSAFGVQNVEATGTIYIQADGSIEPATAPVSRVAEDIYIFTDNVYDSIVVERDNIVLNGGGYTLHGAGSGKGIDLAGRNNVTIKDTKIEDFDHGIHLYESSGNCISENNITANNYYGIWLEDSSGNSISQNNITHNHNGIMIDYSSNNGIRVNNIAANNYSAIEFTFSSNNSICLNNITRNHNGIMVDSSSDNTFYHNNFINNTDQVYSFASINTWDDSYPSGGNYWSDYADADLYSGLGQNEIGSDGIWDHLYAIYEDNQDGYPFAAPISVLDAGIWKGTPCRVHVVSNSTISEFQLNEAERVVGFNVTGQAGWGFCRVTIPKLIVQELWRGNYTVLVRGQPVEFRNWTDTMNTYIYFVCQYSEQKVTIVSEFPLFLILPLFIIATLLVVIVCKRMRSKIDSVILP